MVATSCRAHIVGKSLTPSLPWAFTDIASNIDPDAVFFLLA